jgi:hypothetical protein
MRSPGILNYDIAQLEKSLANLPSSLWPKGAAEKLARWKAELPVARRRYLKQLASALRHKADVYYPGKGRVFSFERKFKVSDDGRLLLDGEEVNPDLFSDGHGRPIIPESSY